MAERYYIPDDTWKACARHWSLFLETCATTTDTFQVIAYVPGYKTLRNERTGKTFHTQYFDRLALITNIYRRHTCDSK